MTAFSPDIINRFTNLVNGAKRIAIVCHMTPDGDALGSSLCLMHTLRAMGKNVTVITPDAFPRTLAFLPGAHDISVATYQHERSRHALHNADLLFCLDFNDLKRIDRLATLVEASRCPHIMLDHHLNPAIEADISVSNPQKSSTCLLLFELLQATGMDVFVGKDAATCCCAGMMTDTGNFAYNANDPDIYPVLAALMARGVDKDTLYNKLFNTNSLTRIRLMGYCQYAKTHVMTNHHCAIITLSRKESQEFGYNKGDTEGLVNVPLSIPGIIYSIYLRQDEENYVKVSMRSKGSFSVKDLCEKHFGGGGHHNAAGGEVHGSLDEAFNQVIALLPECDLMIKNLESEYSSNNQ